MINKYFFIGLFFLLVGALSAQKTKAQLIFKDGTKLKGLAQINRSDKIKFRKSPKAKKEHYSFQEVDTLKIYYDSQPTSYVCVRVKDFEQPKVLEIGYIGENVVYYKETVNSYSAPMMMNGGGGVTVMTAPGEFYSINQSYVRKIGETEVTYLGSSSWFSKNFKKTASKFFEACPELVAKIQNKEFRKRDLEEIILFYNTKCELN